MGGSIRTNSLLISLIPGNWCGEWFVADCTHRQHPLRPAWSSTRLAFPFRDEGILGTASKIGRVRVTPATVDAAALIDGIVEGVPNGSRPNHDCTRPGCGCNVG